MTHFFYSEEEIDVFTNKFGYNFTKCLLHHDPGVNIRHVLDILIEYGSVISTNHWRWLVQLDNGCFALIFAYCENGDWDEYASTYAVVHTSLLQCVFSEQDERALTSSLYRVLSLDPQWKVENDEAFQEWREEVYKMAV